MVRLGFISNSSSCSFLVDLGIKNPKFGQFVSLFEGKLDEVVEFIQDHDEDIYEEDLLFFLYKNMKNCEEYEYTSVEEQVKRMLRYSEPNEFNNTSEEEMLKNKDSLVSFEFTSEGVNFDNENERISSMLEGYGLGRDIFKDFKYWETTCH